MTMLLQPRRSKRSLAAEDAVPLRLEAGARPLPGYTLVRRLGRGGFGEVWEARAPGGARVALKFVRLGSEKAAPELRALEVVRDIRHPHLLDVQFSARAGDCLAIAMPLCDGTLMDRLTACRSQGLTGVPRDELLGTMGEVARAIDFLNAPRHRRGPGGTLVGVQHRDIKPQNIFLVGGSARLADFGLAKALEATLATHSGDMSPHYAAPEAHHGKVTRWTDQYSLAVAYCELRTGRRPFEAATFLQVIYAHAHLAPDLSALPAEERPVVARALAKRPEDRWPTCRAFVRGLKAATTSASVSAVPAGLPDPPVAGPETRDTVTQSVPMLSSTSRPRNPARPVANALGMKLALIPAGAFAMGAGGDDDLALIDEKPRHQVRISRPFFLGVFAVTQEEYEAVMGENPSWFSPDGGGRGWVSGEDTRRHPVENVSWNDAIAFCNKLSEREGLTPYYRIGKGTPSGGDGYRLPTEAEWEYACRAGSPARYAFGDDAVRLGDHGWYSGNAGNRTHRSGEKRPNAFGLHDMHGNVWEWCGDGYNAGYYGRSPEVDPTGPTLAVDRVIRGGCWRLNPRDLRSSVRYAFAPGDRSSRLGFRVARSLA